MIRETDLNFKSVQSQFGKIKAYYYNVGRIDWNNFRAENHQYVIEVMEQNLQGLREVSFYILLVIGVPWLSSRISDAVSALILNIGQRPGRTNRFPGSSSQPARTSCCFTSRGARRT